jgi:hypothetical protein
VLASEAMQPNTPALYANLLDAAVVAGVATTQAIAGRTQPARRIVIGVVGAAGVTLTRPDGTTCVVSKAQCDKLGGVLDRQCIAVQSANSTDISVEY